MSEQNQSLSMIGDHLLELVAKRTAHLETLTEDLKLARDAAEAANQAKGRFLGMVSHELRTPMNAIIGFTEIMHKEGLPPRQDALAGKIKSATDQLLELINGILEFSRHEAGVAEPFNLRSLLMDACKAPFATARAKGLTVHLALDPSLPETLSGDARRLAMVLRILAGNAAKFTTQGSVQVRVRRLPDTGDGKIPVRFEIEDTGSGIPQERQAGLFEAFHQLDDSATRKHGGVGIGLSLARQAVQMMQGEIGLNSPPGGGCTFWLELRLAPTTAAAPVATPTTQPLEQLEQCPTEVPPTDSPCDTASTLAALVRLEQLLQESDTRAARVFEEATPCLRKTLGSHFDLLAGQIAGFEFDSALPIVQALRHKIQEKENLS
jgi:signal transduction histidine kinase